MNFLYLSKIFTFKQKLLVKNLGTPNVKVFQLFRFLYLHYMEGAMPHNDRSPVFVKENKPY